MIKYLMLVLVIAVVGVMAATAFPSEAQGLPVLPMVLYGDVTLGDQPAVRGKVVIKRSDGTVVAKCAVSPDGDLWATNALSS